MKNDGTVFTLENEELLIRVERRGAELSRIYDKRAGRDLLWEADPAVWGRHAPILFPFVGKSWEGTYRHGGKAYPMGQHGFARDMEFEPVLCDMDECLYRLADTEETRERYPFRFVLEAGVRLAGRSIEVTWRVENRDSEEMYFMLGGHPAFRVPEGKTIYDYTLTFNQEAGQGGDSLTALRYQAPDADGFREEALAGTLALKEGRVPITRGFFDKALTYIFDEGQVKSVGLLVDGAPYVTVLCDGFPYVGVWTIEATHPFVCLEPWFGTCDKKGYEGELKDRDGVIALAGWSTWEKSYTICVE